jgi:alpha-L-fucosidase
MKSTLTLLMIALPLVLNSAPVPAAFSNGVAATPPMGWNSYDAWGTSITEAETLANAAAMSKFLRPHGWEYVVIDARWYDSVSSFDDRDFNKERSGVRLAADEFGRLLPATNRFPSSVGGVGFKPLADQIHALGLKFGFHMMRGIPRQAVLARTPIEGSAFTAADAGNTNSICGWCPDMFGVQNTAAGQAWYDSMFRLYAAWGLNFIKVDDLSVPYSAHEIEMIRKAIDKCGRPIVFSTSPGPTEVRYAEHVRTNANMWRISGDFWDRWKDLNHAFDLIAAWQGVGRPGHWPDADMIPFGHLGIKCTIAGKERQTRFTKDEQRTLMSLWSLASSPLMLGANLTDLDDWTLSLLTNDEVLAVNQDALGRPARCVQRKAGGEIWVKELQGGSKAVGLFNRTDKALKLDVLWSEVIGLSNNQQVRDLWAHKDLGKSKSFSVELPPHGSTLLSVVSATALPSLPPMPAISKPQPPDSVPMGALANSPEVKLDLPIAPGPFQPTWASIEKNYPGTPDWLRQAKFGIWVHFGPQASGESGDWYARKMYVPGTTAYNNHLKKYGPPSESGYKEVLRDWNPDKLDPAKLTEIYKDAGARFLMIQGVHHDNFDLWNSHYQPWNAVNLGPKRDLLGEWAKACRADGMRFGVTFHHEYTWWWWQTAFGGDKDANLTLADGKGKWWEGLDPRRLYGIDLREYQGVTKAAYSPWSPPPAGVFVNHLDYAKWYATQWALRMMDVVDQYSPDFIYTDGTDQQPFSGGGTGTGIKADAMQRVIADFYNTTLARRGKVDTFSIVKFRKKTNGTVNTEEGGIPGGIKTDQAWIAETPVGDWFYAPGFTYDSGMVVRYLLEEVSRDGNVAVCISLLPDGSLDDGSRQMLKQAGEWMRLNGEGIYGSHAWVKYGEGQQHLPGGKLGSWQANCVFKTDDFRFTAGTNGCLYAYCMTVPAPGTQLKITSFGTDAKLLAGPVQSVSLLGGTDKLVWKQEPDGLVIDCPKQMPFRTAVGFKVEFNQPIVSASTRNDSPLKN